MKLFASALIIAAACAAAPPRIELNLAEQAKLTTKSAYITSKSKGVHTKAAKFTGLGAGATCAVTVHARQTDYDWKSTEWLRIGSAGKEVKSLNANCGFTKQCSHAYQRCKLTTSTVTADSKGALSITATHSKGVNYCAWNGYYMWAHVTVHCKQATQHRLTKLTDSIYRKTPMTQPNYAPVSSRQDYTQRCSVFTSNYQNCPQPTAHAYDHQERSTPVKTTIYKIDEDGKRMRKLVKRITFNKRATFMYHFDSKDHSDNWAQRLIFVQMFDDFVGPKIKVCRGVSEFVQGAAKWQLCESSAVDQYDGVVTGSMRYRIWFTHTKTHLCKNCRWSQAWRMIKSTRVGKYVITMTAWDKAFKYGRNGMNNHRSAVKTITVKDTLRPWIRIMGRSPMRHECGTKYNDMHAVCADKLDTLALGKKLRVWAKSSVKSGRKGHYTVHYSCRDTAGNKAAAAMRKVQVVDRTPPKIRLRGPSMYQVYAQKTIKDQGVIASDMCDGRGNLRITRSWNRKWDGRTLGTYWRTYCAYDLSGNKACVRRKFVLVDDIAPIIKIIGRDYLTLEAHRNRIYTDGGATCKDYVNGDISKAITRKYGKGGPVDMSKPGYYTITYHCRDLSGNVAAWQKRKIWVKDTTCPKITLKGKNAMWLEAGFAFIDPGAKAYDSLDGDISKKIFTDGDTVDSAYAYYSRQSCSEIKATFPVSACQGGCKKNMLAAGKYGRANTGYYWITTKTNGKFKRQHVFCDMSGKGHTFKKCKMCKCSKYGMVRAKWVSKVAKYHFNKKYWGYRRSNLGLCTTGVHNIRDVKHFRDVDRHSTIGRAESGKYVIRYLVKDAAGNRQCRAPTRTVIVADDLPPVITLHLKNKLIHMTDSKANMGLGHGHTFNPAGRVNGNPFLLPSYKPKPGSIPNKFPRFEFMAETQSSASVNGWILASLAASVTGIALLAYGKN